VLLLLLMQTGLYTPNCNTLHPPRWMQHGAIKHHNPTEREKAMTLPKTDKQLTTIDEISERIKSIEKQRDSLESQGYKNNSIQSFNARHAKLAKLTERHGSLWWKRAEMLKEQKLTSQQPS
jgi:hypothetical protein